MPSNQSVCWNQLPEIKSGHAPKDGKSRVYWTNETAVIKEDVHYQKESKYSQNNKKLYWSSTSQIPFMFFENASHLPKETLEKSGQGLFMPVCSSTPRISFKTHRQ